MVHVGHAVVVLSLQELQVARCRGLEVERGQARPVAPGEGRARALGRGLHRLGRDTWKILPEPWRLLDDQVSPQPPFEPRNVIQEQPVILRGIMGTEILSVRILLPVR